MGLISLNCPNCGAKLDNLDDSRDTYFCTYCGHRITHDKTIIEHRGSINLTGVANENSLLQRANNFLEDYKFNDAKDYYERVLDINPANGAAYMGLLLCKHGVRNTESLKTRVPIDFSWDAEYKKALKFASSADLARYKDVNGSEHQFMIQMKGRNTAIKAGCTQLEKERDELLDKQNTIKRNAEWELEQLKRRTQDVQEHKARNAKELGKAITKAILIILAGIAAFILGAYLNGTWSAFGLIILAIALISQIVAIVKTLYRINNHFNPKKILSQHKIQYKQETNELNGAINLIDKINANYTKRINDYMAAAESEKQKFIQDWKEKHPNDRVYLYTEEV